MHNANNRATSLLEVLIGFFLLASASVIFIQSMLKFKTETVFYSEHFVASALIERVLEQCYQETDLNPHGMQTLGLADASGNPYSLSTEITNGRTVFFQNPEISQEKFEALHRMVNDNFLLSLEPTRESGYYELKAGFSWPAKHGRGVAETFCRVLGFDGIKQVETDLEFEDSFVEKRLVSVVFSAPETALSSHISNSGVREFVMNAGHAYFSGYHLLSSRTFQDRCKKLKEMESDGSIGSAEYAECSRAYFEIARDLLHLMMAMQPRVENIRKNLNLVTMLPDRSQIIIKGHIRKSGHYFNQIRSLFLASILKLAERYEKEADYSINAREQRMTIGRLFNLYRILHSNRNFLDDVVTSGSSKELIDRKHRKFLSNIKAYFQTKDPSIARMASQDESFVNSDDIKDKYSLPGTLFQLFQEFDALEKIVF